MSSRVAQHYAAKEAFREAFAVEIWNGANGFFAPSSSCLGPILLLSTRPVSKSTTSRPDEVDLERDDHTRAVVRVHGGGLRLSGESV